MTIPSPLYPWLVASLAFVVYLSSEMMHPGDSPPNIYTALSQVEEGNSLITPKETPFLFRWRLHVGKESSDIAIQEMDDRIERWIDEGVIDCVGPYAHLVGTQKPGFYLSTFGPGTGTIASPFLWLARCVVGDLRERCDVLWWVGRIVGALCVAGSVAFLFLFAAERSDRNVAMIVSLLYAFGTCVWSTSSQGLWQHSPNGLFLSASIYAFTRSKKNQDAAFWCGVAISAATWCRPTSALFAMAYLVSYALSDQKLARRFFAGTLPLAVCLAAFNHQQLGSPLRFGQSEMGSLAVEKTGKEGVFQTPIQVGAAGLLISPSRGLFVYSPFLAFAIPGVWAILVRGRIPELRPAMIAMLIIWMIEFKHFDWWGGWSFGYRHLVDSTFLLSAALVVTIPPLLHVVILRNIFIGLAIWSICIQVLAIAAYDIGSWNARRAFEVTAPTGEQKLYWDQASIGKTQGSLIREIQMDIDHPNYRHRLWSWNDNQIGYLTAHFKESQEERRKGNAVFLRPKSAKLAAFHELIGRKWIEAKDLARAQDALAGAQSHGSSSHELARMIEDARAKEAGGPPASRLGHSWR
ncbi:glycosyltransferase family 39 protein [bacterium]|nr:glycosyltransferase family 39 protein [bacterium]